MVDSIKRPVHPTVLAMHLRDDGVFGGCETYRIGIPYGMIRQKVPSSVLDWAPIGMVREWAAGKIQYRVRPSDYDMWVLARHRPLPYGTDSPPDIILETIKKASGIELEGKAHLLDLVRLVKGKIKVVLEYDDDHWGSRDLGYSEHVDLAKELLRQADAITVTTPHLRNLVQSLAPGIPVYILPNCVNFAEWQGWDRWNRWPEDWLVLGLTGSTTHYQDWIVLENVLPQIFEKHEKVAFLLQGFVPDYFQEFLGSYPDRVYVNKEFQEYKDYPGTIRQADIVLCPVDPEDRFNLAKSQIKAVEGMASGRVLSNGEMGGAAVIASQTPYYRQALGSGNKRGILVGHTPREWYEAIDALITDKDRREHYQHKGRSWVWRNRAIEGQWKLWWTAYQEIYRRR